MIRRILIRPGNVRDAWRQIVGWAGFWAGLGGIVGPGSPSVAGFFDSRASVLTVGWLLMLGGLLNLAAWAVQHGDRPVSVRRLRAGDALEFLGVVLVAVFFGMTATIVAIQAALSGYPPPPPGAIFVRPGPHSVPDWRALLASSATVAAQGGVVLACLWRLRRLATQEDGLAGAPSPDDPRS